MTFKEKCRIADYFRDFIINCENNDPIENSNLMRNFFVELARKDSEIHSMFFDTETDNEPFAGLIFLRECGILKIKQQ